MICCEKLSAHHPTFCAFQACFAGGNLLLGGVYLDRPDIYELGVNVADGCHNSYNTTVTGLGPFCELAQTPNA